MSEFRCVVKNLLLACVVMVGSVISLPAFAAGGACIWEGGVGAQDTNSDGEYDVNASCWLEDCDGNGGIADCKAPKQGYRPKIIPSETDSEGWTHNVCLADQGGVTATVAFCEGNGGVWMGGNPSYCDDSNFQAGITWIGGITESNVNQAADNYIDKRFGACSSLTGDSGWPGGSSSQCFGSVIQQYSNGILVRDGKVRSYNQCSTSTNRNVYITRNRQTESFEFCEFGTLRMNESTSDNECVIPAPLAGTANESTGVCPEVGDPCNVVSGVAWDTRVDYEGPFGLRFARTYRSVLYSPSDRSHYLAATNRHLGVKWTHNFEARIHFKSAPASTPIYQRTPIGLYRPDGTYASLKRLGSGVGGVSDVYVATDGSQIQLHKQTGGAAFWLYQPSGESEYYETYAGSGFWKGVRLKKLIDADGRVTEIHYRWGTPANPTPPNASQGGIDNDVDAYWEIEKIVGPHGHEIQFNYTMPPLPCSGEACVRRLTSILLPDGQTEIQYCYDNLSCSPAYGKRLSVVNYEDDDGSGTDVETYDYNATYYPADPNLLTLISGDATAADVVFGYDYFTGRVTDNWLVGSQHTMFKKVDIQYFSSPTNSTEVTDGATTASYLFQNDDARNPKIQSRYLEGVAEGVVQINQTTGQFRLKDYITHLGQTHFEYDSYHLLSVKEGYDDVVAPSTFVRDTAFTDYLNTRTSLPEVMEQPSVSGCAGAKKITTYSYAGTAVASMTVTGKNPLDCSTVSRTWQFNDHNAWGQPREIDGPRNNSGDAEDITDIVYWGDSGDLASPSCNASGGFECGAIYKISSRLGTSTHDTLFNQYNADGFPENITTPSGAQISLVWDDRQQLKSITSTGSNKSVSTVFTYYSNKSLHTAKLPNGLTLTYLWDADVVTRITDQLGNAIDYDYDSRGNVSEITHELPGSVIKKFVSIVSDIRNHVDTIQQGTVAGGAGHVTDLDFDQLGNLLRIKDGRTNEAYLKFDALSRMKTIADPQTSASNPNNSYGYDLHDNVTSVTSPNGALTQFWYDDLDNIVKEVSPDRGTTIFEYDPAGNLVCRLDGRYSTASSTSCTGQPGAVTFEYDALNRIVSTDYQADASLNKTYNWDAWGKGELSSIYYANRSDYIWRDYDALGRITGQFDYIDNGIGGVEQLGTTYAYASTNDRLSAIQYHKPLAGTGGPSGLKVDYKYDTGGRVVGVWATYNSGTTKIIDGDASNPAVTYLPFGPVASLKFANGVTQQWVYDNAYRIDKIEVRKSNATLLASWDYVLDGNGNVEEINHSGSQLQRQYVSNYSYDEMDRLASESGGNGNSAFSYDDNANINSASLNFSYAANSNRFSSSVATYEGGPSNPGGFGMGNLETRGNTNFTFDADGRLAVLSQGNQVATNLYNGFGERAYTKRFLPNGAGTADDKEFLDYYTYAEDGRLLSFVNSEITGGVQGVRTVYYYIWLEQIPVGVLELKFNSSGSPISQQFVMLHADHLYQPRLATGWSNNGYNTQAIIWEYDAIWSPAHGWAFPDNDPDDDGRSINIVLRFPGHVYYGLSFFHYNYTRDYDASTGRYLQSDRIGLAGGLNTYVYANANPLRFTDPTGEAVLIPVRCLSSSECRGLAAGGALALADIAYQLYEHKGDVSCLDAEEVWGAAVAGYSAASLAPVGFWNKIAGRVAAKRALAARGGAGTVQKELSALRAGRGYGVKEVQSAEELQGIFSRISRGGSPVEGTTYSGQLVRLRDGTTVGMRATSKSGGPTIDIKFPDGIVQKIHVSP